ncbi:pyridoxamine 5'-phosphate oxidase family protein [Paractinoplanes lichenicola]|uniref:Pyridoxamine 5'-phosphate oxidase family protein n=1 Tax=Paractinoplanes lichenicola TaxID=2802976 RepID=A0ABS1VGR9_9ACTN|nr:pyridoxamine 5'-phosphate oxidase family protein [Actinoplanes lichenicola]MBL7253820.1 pyridoxamine 5'-phosphate oxidase family protein [Actinoplanes lichenicola]
MTDPTEPDASLVEHAREVLGINRFLTLGTVSAAGQPWTSPVYFSWVSVAESWEFFWVSAADAQHSLNLLDRPAVALTVFDSSVPPYHGRAVYAVGEAREVPLEDLDETLQHYPGPESRGGRVLTRSDVTGDQPWRFYQAGASELWVLCPGEPGAACDRHDIMRDHRARVL